METKYQLKIKTKDRIRAKLSAELAKKVSAVKNTLASDELASINKLLQKHFIYAYQKDGGAHSKRINQYACHFSWDGSPIKALGHLRMSYIPITRTLKCKGLFTDAVHNKHSITFSIKEVTDTDLFTDSLEAPSTVPTGVNRES